MKRLSAFFYVFIGFLTAVLLITLSLWIVKKTPLLLYLIFGEFALYVAIVTLNMIRNSIEVQTNEKLKSEFLLLLKNVETKIVYITYLGNEKRIKKPSHLKRDYLIEFYPNLTDIDLLKRHLWFHPSEQDEKFLESTLIGGLDIPYPLLNDISGKKLVLQKSFYEDASTSPLFESFLLNNEIILYGDQT